MDKLPLPPPLASDERFTCLARLAAERFAQLDLTALLVYLVDLVNVTALPRLAEQFHVQGLEGWRFARNERQKRDLIKRAIELHRYKGTQWAVRQVLEILQLTGEISEWFDYGGKPHFFRIDVALEQRGLNEEEFNSLVSLIHEYKSVRSKLESLTLRLINQSSIPVIGCAALAGEVVTVLPSIITGRAQAAEICLAAGVTAVEFVTLEPFFP